MTSSDCYSREQGGVIRDKEATQPIPARDMYRHLGILFDDLHYILEPVIIV